MVQRLDISGNQIFLTCIGVEVAIGTAVNTKRDVKVKRVKGGHVLGAGPLSSAGVQLVKPAVREAKATQPLETEQVGEEADQEGEEFAGGVGTEPGTTTLALRPGRIIVHSAQYQQLLAKKGDIFVMKESL